MAERFAARLIEDLGPQPPNFQRIVEINRGPLLREGVEGHPLAPRQVEQKRAEGALVVDVRTDLQFDDAHVPGAVCITMLRAGFGSKLAWIADAEQEIVFVGRDDADARRAVELAAAVGLDRIGGFLHGGMTSWREERRPVAQTERMSAPELHGRMEEEPGLQVVDVREESEWRAGRIPGSLHVPYHDMHALPDGVDPERPVAAVCSSGQRAAVAASLLQRRGAKASHPRRGRRGQDVARARLGVGAHGLVAPGGRRDVWHLTACVIPSSTTDQEDTWQPEPARESSATRRARIASSSSRCSRRRTGWRSRR